MAQATKLQHEERLGDATLRIVSASDGYRGVVIRKGMRGEILDDSDLERLKARLRNEAGKLHPNYFGMGGAISRFLGYFPQGFETPRYLEMERNYKLRARERLLEVLPLSKGSKVDREQAVSCRKPFQTNMISTFEHARVGQVLTNEEGPAFVRAAAKFAEGDIAAGLKGMCRAVEPYGRPSWPIVTYLPFLWKPEDHMFLKPEKTVDFAERIGHPFAHQYSAELVPGVYHSFLEMAAAVQREIAKLKPRDRIDVQSFIWVVGDYGADQAEDL